MTDRELTRHDRACLFVACMCFVAALGVPGLAVSGG